MAQITFEGVKGYISYANAVKRGEEVAAKYSGTDKNLRWVVIALPNGRFTPSFIHNQNSTFPVGNLIGENNICVMN